LRLVLAEGRIGKVRFADGGKEVYWKSVFPFREGDILKEPLIK
jgi:hemolysin activation/secretion protein